MTSKFSNVDQNITYFAQKKVATQVFGQIAKQVPWLSNTEGKESFYMEIVRYEQGRFSAWKKTKLKMDGQFDRRCTQCLFLKCGEIQNCKR